MLCRKCGELLRDNARTCPICGASVQKSRQNSRSVLNPMHVHYDDCSARGHDSARSSVGFGQAVSLFFRNTLNFRGRSRRSEYCWALLFVVIVTAFVSLVDPDAAGYLTLVLLLPTLSLTIRRLHDIGITGWACLISLIPPLSLFAPLILCCIKSTPRGNK